MGLFGSSKVEAPPVDPNVSALNAMNLNLLQNSLAMNQRLEPLQLQQMGLVDVRTPEYKTLENYVNMGRLNAAKYPNDAASWNAFADQYEEQLNAMGPAYRKMTEDEYYGSLSPTERQSYDLQKKAYERTMKAYAGELPIDTQLSDELGLQEEAVKEKQRRGLGLTWEGSTSGNQAMNNWLRNKAGIIDAASRAQITTGEGLQLARQGAGAGLSQQNFQNYVGYPQSGLAYSSGLVNATQPYLNYANMQYNANQANAANSNAMRTGLMQGIGNLGGLALGGYLGGLGKVGAGTNAASTGGVLGGGWNQFANKFSFLS